MPKKFTSSALLEVLEARILFSAEGWSVLDAFSDDAAISVFHLEDLPTTEDSKQSDFEALQLNIEGFNTSLESELQVKRESVAAVGSNVAFSSLEELAVGAVLNTAPTLSIFVSPIDTVDEDKELTLTFSDLINSGDEADADGVIDHFIVESLGSGILKIGTSSVDATLYQAGSNDVIDSAHNAYWTPDENFNGTVTAMSVVAVDDGGAQSTGPVVINVDVTSQPDAPEGVDNTISVTVDTTHTFLLGDFSFIDADGDTLAAIRVETLPALGTLELDGVALNTGDEVFAADVSAGKLVYTPALGAAGNAYDSFTFAIQDTGTAGSNLDTTPNVMAINVRDGIVDISTGLELNVDGGNDAYLISNSALGVVLDAMTYEIQFAAESSTEHTFLVSYANPEFQNAIMIVMLGTSDTLVAFVGSNRVNLEAIDYRASLYDGKKHTFTFTWESVTGRWASYIDGIEIEEGFSLLGASVDATEGLMVLGQDQDSVGGGFAVTDVFSGVIYDARIWDRELSINEVAQHYNHKFDPNNLPENLIANWQMKELDGSNEVVDIVSGNNLALAHVAGGGFIASEVRTDLHIYENSANESHAGYVVPDESVTSDNLLDLTVHKILSENPGVVYNAETGSFYLAVYDSLAIADATADANARLLNGVPGQLVSINTELENDYLKSIMLTSGTRFLTSGNDVASEGEWVWQDGTQFWQGEGDGIAIDGSFTDWAGTLQQPSNSHDTGEQFLELRSFGWNDITADIELAYVVEWDAQLVSQYRYALTDDANGRFAVDEYSGEVTVADGTQLNYELDEYHDIAVQVTSGTGNSYVKTLRIEVDNVNEAPAGIDNAISILEDASYTFTASDFTFSDPESNSLSAIIIDTLPTKGELSLPNQSVAVGLVVPVTEIANLQYTSDENAVGIDTLVFRVADDGGVSHGGVDTSLQGADVVINIIPVSDPPEGADNVISVTSDTSHTFSLSDFLLTDVDGDGLAAIVVETLPVLGALELNGIALGAGAVVTVADVNAGNFIYRPTQGSSGDSFTFSVRDNGTADLNTDLIPNTMNVEVRAGIVDISSGLEINADGGNDAYLISSAPLGIVADAFTYEIQFAVQPSSVNSVLISYAAPGGDNQNTLMLQMEAGSNSLVGFIDATRVDFTGYDYRAALYDGNRHALALVWESSTGQWITYIDGIEVDQGIGALGRTVDFTSGKLVLGQEQDAVGSRFSTTEYFAGVMYDVRFWDKVLSSEEIQEHHNHKLDPNNLPENLIANWQMKEFNGSNEVVDIVSGNNLTLAHVSGDGFFASEVRTDLHIYENSINESHIGYVLPDESASGYNLLDVSISNILSENPGVVYNAETGSFYLPVYDSLAIADATVDANARLLNGVAGQLVSINTELENDYLKSIMLTAGTRFLTSGNDVASEGDWVWQDGTQFWQGEGDGIAIDGSFTDWAGTLEPNNSHNTGEHALELRAYGWNDISADTQLAYVVEWDAQIVSQYRYALTDDANGRFAIDEYSGEVTVADGTQLNYELDEYHDIVVQVTSGTGNSYVKTLRIEVDNVNEAPAGIDHTISILEDTNYTFTASDFDFTDPESNTLSAIVIDTLPSIGTLQLNGSAVSVGMQVAVAQISDLTYVAAPNNIVSDDIEFRVIDDGGTVGSGVDTDQTPNKISIDITAVNDAPNGQNNTVGTFEDVGYRFSNADFPFTDVDNNSLLSVGIVSLPAVGQLSLNGIPVQLGQEVPQADITDLMYTPPVNAYGSQLGSFSFQLRDNGGTSSGGIDLDPTWRAMLIDVASVNDAPQGKDNILNLYEDTAYAFVASDFGFSDIENNSFSSVTIDTLPFNGQLVYSGVPVAVGQVISINAINTLEFIPEPDANRTAYDTFAFSVGDDGGVINGGTDVDLISNSININLLAINDAPQGTDKVISTLEDSSYQFIETDFGFIDSDNHNLQSVLITTLPINGQLLLSGVPVVSGQVIARSLLPNVTFEPSSDAYGASYSGFTFKVQDDGGVSNAGVDTDLTANVITFDVTSVNDAPAGSDKIITTSEDLPYDFSIADFGFSDSDNNNFQAITIITTPAIGQLLLSSVIVTEGQIVNASQISNLQFVPKLDAHQLGYDNFSFVVSDDGGTINGGTDTDLTPNVISVDLLGVNDAPTAVGATVTTLEDTQYLFRPVDFGFSDVDSDSFKELVVQTIPSNGSLLLAGATVTMGQVIDVAMIPNLSFLPSENANGAGFDSFQYLVRDDGGTANGGTDISAIAGVINIDVLAVNDAPYSVGSVVTTLEDTPYVFNAADFVFTDTESHGLLSVAITSLPQAGLLNYDSAPVTVGQVIEASRLSDLVYHPEDNSNVGAVFNYQIQDDGGVVSGGQDSVATDSVMTIQLTPVNDAPLGIDTVVTTFEDTSYQFTSNDFSFSDIETDSLSAVVVSVLPVNGILLLAGVPVTVNQVVEAEDIEGLEYLPNLNSHGTAHDVIHVLILDSGGIVNGGSDTAIEPLRLQVDVTSVNDAPAGGDSVIEMLEDSTYRLQPEDFNFTDAADTNEFRFVRIDSLPVLGRLYLAGVEVVSGQLISHSSLLAGDLEFVPGSNANGLSYGDFGFQVIDGGGNSNGGSNTDSVPNYVSFNVLPANDPPESADVTIEVVEDNAFIFSPAQFAFSDEQDLNVFDSIVIESLPSSGRLQISGDNVLVGQVISATDLLLGNLIYHPLLDANGSGLTSFTFRVLDDGTGIENSNRSINAYTVFIDVLSVNDAPRGNGSSTDIVEEGVHLFQSGEFGFTDTPDGDGFTGLLVTQLPGIGELSVGSEPVVKGKLVTLAEIESGLFSYAAPNDIAADIELEIAEFGFRVIDSGGTLRAGVNTDLEDRFTEFKIAAVNDAPSLSLTDVAFDEGSQNLIDSSLVSATDIDDSAAELILTVASGPRNGVLQLNGTPIQNGATLTVGQLINNELYYVHNGSETTTDTFQLSLKDGGENGVQPVIGQFNIAVNEVIDPLPELIDDNLAIVASEFGSENGTSELPNGSGSVLDNDTLLSPDEHFITLETEPEHGIVTLNDDGTFNYTHNGGLVLEDSFTYRVTNSDDLYQIATVLVTVEPPMAAAFTAPIATVDVAAVEVEPVESVEELMVEQSSEPEPEAEAGPEVEPEPEAEPESESEPEAEPESELEAELAGEELGTSFVGTRSELYGIESEDSIVLFQSEIETLFSTRMTSQGFESTGVQYDNRIDSVVSFFEGSKSAANRVNLLLDLEVRVLELRTITDNNYFQDALGRVDEELDFANSDHAQKYELGSETAFSVSLSATAGALVWALRGGAFFASMMAGLPLWSSIDPVQVMVGKSRSEEEPSDSVERVFDD